MDRTKSHRLAISIAADQWAAADRQRRARLGRDEAGDEPTGAQHAPSSLRTRLRDAIHPEARRTA